MDGRPTDVRGGHLRLFHGDTAYGHGSWTLDGAVLDLRDGQERRWEAEIPAPDIVVRLGWLARSRAVASPSLPTLDARPTCVDAMPGAVALTVPSRGTSFPAGFDRHNARSVRVDYPFAMDPRKVGQCFRLDPR